MEETANAALPAGRMMEFIYESLGEQKRDKMLGQGIFLGTVHSAKGMEFSHVFIPSGDWKFPSRVAGKLPGKAFKIRYPRMVPQTPHHRKHPCHWHDPKNRRRFRRRIPRNSKMQKVGSAFVGDYLWKRVRIVG